MMHASHLSRTLIGMLVGSGLFPGYPTGALKRIMPRNLPEPLANGVENKDFVFCPDNL